MKAAFACVLTGLVLLGGAVHAADPLPKRDLTVELRQTEEGREEAGHYSAGGDSNAAWEPQLVQVRNGEKAVLRLNDAIPMQWTQSVTAPNPAANTGAGVTNALVWFDAGQSITVQPKWPGGNKPAVLEIEVQRASVDPQSGAALPKQTRNMVSTTITAPLAEWVTIAATGKAPRPGVYSSESALQVRRLLQVRVMAQ
jgi:hypothetical protein